VAIFLTTISRRFPNNAAVHSLLGYAQVQAGDRRSALASLRQAYRIDPTNKETISALARLQALPASVSKAAGGWQLPFPIKAVFEKPTPAEIRAVEADWRARDLSPRDVREVTKKEVMLAGSESVVRIVSHRVHGRKHYGAIIIPPNAKPGCCPVVIEAKGVSPSYFPLELNRLHTLAFIGDLRQQFIYVVPSYRGEILKFDGVDYQSEGDRTDAWDGATDDAIALLNVALQTTPEADQSRICAFGQSRGGTIALLMGIRDRRVGCVVDSAGPTDWFELMGTEGWTQEEIFAEGLRTRAGVEETGGQLIEHFLMKAIRGEENLQAVRRRMLAGSPLYFAGRLPRALLHYGNEDPYVPVRNGLQLVAQMKRQLVPAKRYQAFFYPGEGHDTDRLAAPVLSRQFIARMLLRK
jgi:tetratricopeptide (TPR) repeat protein